MKKYKKQIKSVLCIRNEGCEDLQPRKIYQVIPDDSASVDGYMRVIDESREDYLYPENYFIPIKLTQPVKCALLIK
jgi:hypothetical protein